MNLNHNLAAAALLTICTPAVAQAATELPYATGSVDAFLRANKAASKQSVVLYNFNLESG